MPNAASVTLFIRLFQIHSNNVDSLVKLWPNIWTEVKRLKNAMAWTTKGVHQARHLAWIYPDTLTTRISRRKCKEKFGKKKTILITFSLAAVMNWYSGPLLMCNFFRPFKSHALNLYPGKAERDIYTIIDVLGFFLTGAHNAIVNVIDMSVCYSVITFLWLCLF